MKDTIKRYALSSTTTFISAFFIALGIQFSNGINIQLTGAFWFSVLTIAARAGAKAVVEGLAGRHADNV